MSINPLALFVALPIAALTATFVYFVRASSIPEDKPPLPKRDKPSEIERSRQIGYWASSIILGLVYILTGIPKLSVFQDTLHQFQSWGYSENFLLFIGATEFVAGIGLIIPQTSIYAASYLSVVMVGAIYTHIAFGSNAMALLPTFCLSFLVFIIYEDLYHMRYGALPSR